MDLRTNNHSFNNISPRRVVDRVNSDFVRATNDTGDQEDEIKLNDLPPQLDINNLPILATSNDVREVVRFLKQKPAGLSLVEAINFEPKRVFEARKIVAYEYWGIVKRDGERLKLTALGNKLADIIRGESRIFEEIIASTPIYLAVIEWIARQTLKLVSYHEVTKFWQELQNETAPNEADDKKSEAEVVSFFSICHAADLGIATVGKRGQPARLKIEPQRIKEFLVRCKESSGGRDFSNKSSEIIIRDSNNNQKSVSEIHRIYISTEQNIETTENLRRALELADFESISAGRLSNDYLQSSKLKVMQSCQAGVIVVANNDCTVDSNGTTEIRSDRLTEIILAIALFNGRIVFIWDCLLSVPDYLEYYSSYLLIGSVDDFNVGYQTAKLIKGIKLQVESE